MGTIDWRDLTLIPIHSDRPGVAHAAGVLGLNKDRAYGAARDGTLPTIRVGKRLLVPVAKLRQMIGEDEPGPEPDARRALADDLQALADALRRQAEPVAS